jgi:RNA polymerase-binding transcription factor DksA
MSRILGRRLRRRWWVSAARPSQEDGLGRRVQALLEELERRQQDVDELCRRLASPGHGFCRACGRPISARRLELVEGAVLCAACALVARRSRNLLEPLARRN